ncbi:uncharacterized protein LOC143695192 [Agelaius phoeniceus]|uniref:uncharacterized protein LOC143695192 n=1 Tax=Agelaius phoeniceus TaxID=39638 RepID=UPI004054E8E9
MRWHWRRDGENSGAGPAAPSGDARSLGIPFCVPFQPSLASPCAHVCPQPSPLKRGPAAPACPGHHQASRPRPRAASAASRPRKFWGARSAHRARALARAGRGHLPTTPASSAGPGSARLGSAPRPSFLSPLPPPPAHRRTHRTLSHIHTHTHTSSRCSFKGAAAVRGPPHVRPVRSRRPQPRALSRGRSRRGWAGGPSGAERSGCQPASRQV